MLNYIKIFYHGSRSLCHLNSLISTIEFCLQCHWINIFDLKFMFRYLFQLSNALLIKQNLQILKDFKLWKITMDQVFMLPKFTDFSHFCFFYEFCFQCHWINLFDLKFMFRCLFQFNALLMKQNLQIVKDFKLWKNSNFYFVISFSVR